MYFLLAFCPNDANHFVTSLQEIFGGNAASDEYHIGRHVSNLFVVQTYEGQSDIHGKWLRAQPEGTWTWADIPFHSIDFGPGYHWQAGLCLEHELYIDCTSYTKINELYHRIPYKTRKNPDRGRFPNRDRANASPARDIMEGLVF